MEKTILITGAGSGIGLDSAITLAKRGHSVIATTETALQAEKVNQLAKDSRLSLSAFQLDITEKTDRNKISALEVDVLINNAGVGQAGSLAEVPVERIRQNFEVNVFSTIELTQLALKNMMSKNKGTVIFISSLAGRITMPFLAPYCMTKFSLSSGAEILRGEIKKLKKNINICVVEPGAYHTGFNQKMIATKYEWMDESSYFSKMIEKIKKDENKRFKITECRSTQSIIRKIVKACETKNPRFRYTAPWWQSIGTKILRIIK